MIYLEFFVSFVINNLHNKFFSLLFYHGGRAILPKNAQSCSFLLVAIIVMMSF